MLESCQLSHSLPPSVLISLLTTLNLYQNLSTLLVEGWKVINFHILFYSFSLPKPLNFTSWSRKVVNFHIHFLLLCSSLYFSFLLQFFFTQTSQLYLLNVGKLSTFTFSSSFCAHLSTFLSYYSKSLPKPLNFTWWMLESCQISIISLLLCSSLSTFLSYYSFSLPKPLNFTCWMLESCQLSPSLPSSLLISLLFFLTTLNLCQNLSTLLVECWNVVNFHLLFLLLYSSLYFSFLLQFFFAKTSQLYLLTVGKLSTFTFSSSFFPHLVISYFLLPFFFTKILNFTCWMLECCQLSHSLPHSLLISLLFFLTTVFLCQNLSTLHVECWKVVNFHILFLILSSSFSTFLSYYSKSLPKPLNFTCWMLESCQLSHSLFFLLCSSLYFSFLLQFFFAKTSQLYLVNAGKLSTFTFSPSFYAHLSTFLSYCSFSLPKPLNFTRDGSLERHF